MIYNLICKTIYFYLNLNKKNIFVKFYYIISQNISLVKYFKFI